MYLIPLGLQMDYMSSWLTSDHPSYPYKHSLLNLISSNYITVSPTLPCDNQLLPSSASPLLCYPLFPEMFHSWLIGALYDNLVVLILGNFSTCIDDTSNTLVPQFLDFPYLLLSSALPKSFTPMVMLLALSVHII